MSKMENPATLATCGVRKNDRASASISSDTKSLQHGDQVSRDPRRAAFEGIDREDALGALRVLALRLAEIREIVLNFGRVLQTGRISPAGALAAADQAAPGCLATIIEEMGIDEGDGRVE
jgi:hypothetical protein